MLTAEPIEPPENGPNPFEWTGRLGAVGRIAEQPEPFLGEREKDVVLARKVAVDGRRAVLDALRDFSNRHVPVALGREEIARGVENGSTDGLPVALLAFLDPHWRMFLLVNGVHQFNIVRRPGNATGSTVIRRTCDSSHVRRGGTRRARGDRLPR